MEPPRRVEPDPDQESVWDYPRPPRLESSDARVQVWFDGMMVADTSGARRVVETYHPPTYYLPPGDVFTRALKPLSATSYCEWKGTASYFDIESGTERVERAAWAYFDPQPPYAELAGYVSFYPSLVDCSVDGEHVTPQPGAFYGGWVTSAVTGPFKGSPGMDGW